jgi:hypothetical protein
MGVVKWFQRAGIVLLVGVVGISAWRHRDKMMERAINR